MFSFDGLIEKYSESTVSGYRPNFETIQAKVQQTLIEAFPHALREDVGRGVVCLPHGYGHDVEGTELSVAGVKPGVNSNVLTDEAPLDPLSGNAVLNGIPVEVAPAAS